MSIPLPILLRQGALALAVMLTLGATLAAAATELPKAGAAAARPPQALRAGVDAAVRRLMDRYQIPGMAVALHVDGRAYLFNYGHAGLKPRQPVTPATLFELGSVSKVFTATLAAYAEAQGQLSLQAHPSQYLPALRGHAIDQASLLHLGTYTAGGLPLQFPDKVKNDEDARAFFLQWQPSAPPGQWREYSNPSIGLLGEVTAQAMKTPFADAMQAQLLPALGLRHSFIKVPEQALPDYAWGHRDGRPVRVNPGPLAEPAYGLKASAADLLQFVQANLDPSALAPALRQAIARTQVGHYRFGLMVQCLGWEQYPYPISLEGLLGGNAAEVIFDANPVQALAADTVAAPDSARLFSKTGSTGGFGAYVAFVPRKRLGLVMLANSNYPIPARIARGETFELIRGGTRAAEPISFDESNSYGVSEEWGRERLF